MLRCALFPLPAAERLTEKEAEDLMAWMRNALGSRVTGVKVGILCLGNCVEEIHGGNNLGKKRWWLIGDLLPQIFLWTLREIILHASFL